MRYELGCLENQLCYLPEHWGLVHGILTRRHLSKEGQRENPCT